MPKLKIDGDVIEVADGTTLLQACEQAGREIPRFCYHKHLSIAGNCRMCLVEVKGMPKLAASCALRIDDMRSGPDGEPPEVLTNSPEVQKARRGTMELMLVNHPLECPVCDQGGECDLQDQAVAYGGDIGRFTECKRALENRNIGPLINTMMTRCISCMRCVRFMSEIAGVEELGSTGRGEDAEITTYLDHGMLSELSGNVVDVCPVGALTSRPYSAHARPWELCKADGVDIMDALGSNTRLDYRGNAVLRIMPRENDSINQCWLSDKARFAWDGLKAQRLDRPYIRGEDGKLHPASWDDALDLAVEKMSKAGEKGLAIIAGDLCAAEEMFAIKQLADDIACENTDCRQDGACLSPEFGRSSYLLNSKIAGVDSADALLLIGCNPRLEAPVLNARIRRRWLSGNLQVGNIGPRADLTYTCEQIGDNPKSLADLIEGKHHFTGVLKRAKRPMLVIGQGAVCRGDGAGLLSMAARLAERSGVLDAESGWNGLNVLHTAAARVAGLDLGLVPGENGRDVGGIYQGCETGDIGVVYLLAADEIDMQRLGNAFVIYQGSHGDNGAERADLILPGAAFSEKTGTYVNTEGLAQVSPKVVQPPGEAREDWEIIAALAEKMGKSPSFGNILQLRVAMHEVAPQLVPGSYSASSDVNGIAELAKMSVKVHGDKFVEYIEDHYQTNPLARASALMAELSTLNREAADG
jgi:NADH-quinone oxidoreductase subunit G